MSKQGKSNLILTISAGIGAVGFILLGINYTKLGGVLIGIGSIGVVLS